MLRAAVAWPKGRCLAHLWRGEPSGPTVLKQLMECVAVLALQNNLLKRSIQHW